MRPMRPLITAIAFAVAVTSCSSTSDQVADEIAPQVQDQLGLSYEPTVTCPDDAEATKGAEFACTLEIEDGEIPLDVEFDTDTTFTSTVRGAVFERNVLHDEIAAQFGDDVDLVEIDCPGKDVTVIAAGDSVDCAIETSTGDKASVVVGSDGEGAAEVLDVVPTP